MVFKIWLRLSVQWVTIQSWAAIQKKCYIYIFVYIRKITDKIVMNTIKDQLFYMKVLYK